MIKGNKISAKNLKHQTMQNAEIISVASILRRNVILNALPSAAATDQWCKIIVLFLQNVLTQAGSDSQQFHQVLLPSRTIFEQQLTLQKCDGVVYILCCNWHLAGTISPPPGQTEGAVLSYHNPSLQTLPAPELTTIT